MYNTVVNNIMNAWFVVGASDSNGQETTTAKAYIAENYPFTKPAKAVLEFVVASYIYLYNRARSRRRRICVEDVQDKSCGSNVIPRRIHSENCLS